MIKILNEICLIYIEIVNFNSFLIKMKLNFFARIDKNKTHQFCN